MSKDVRHKRQMQERFIDSPGIENLPPTICLDGPDMTLKNIPIGLVLTQGCTYIPARLWLRQML